MEVVEMVMRENSRKTLLLIVRYWAIHDIMQRE